MKNNLIRFIFVLIIIAIFIYAFSSSYVSRNMGNLAYVVAIGFDTSDSSNATISSESGKIKVTFQFVNTSALSQTSSSTQSSSVVNSVEASSLDTALNLMNAYIGKELNLSHCRVIVFSEKFAETDISDEIYTLINNSQIRPTTNIVVSKCDANYYIENSEPSLEQLVTKYYDIFPNSSKYTGYTQNLTIGNFFNILVCDTYNPTAILGGINTNNYNQNTSSNVNDSISNNSNIIGKRETENIGLAVFNGGKLVGELTGFETLWHSVIQNDVDSFIVSVPNPKDDSKSIDLSLVQSDKTKIKVDISKGSPYITIDIKLSGRISSIDSDSDYSNNSYLEEISSYTSSYIKSNISDYLYKTSKDYKSDIDDFGAYASKYFLTEEDWDNYDWLNNYQNAFFTVNVDCNIESALLLSGT